MDIMIVMFLAGALCGALVMALALTPAVYELAESMEELIMAVEIHENVNGHAVAYLARARAALAKIKGTGGAS